MVSETLTDRKVIHVAVGVVRRADGRILIARRPDHLHMGGRWEFPGGKVEEGETVQQALARELREEVAIEAGGLQPLTEIRHDYPEKTVLLDTWWVLAFTGEARGLEAQEVRWVALDELDSYRFPDANREIIAAIRAATTPGNDP
ncbi:8-oxo-dGTP diphosphatase MutT [Microbulbifer yueqingensis]|uniref:8-oxo-dGTP diphosphatase n=1 Tax=Microbulbifer yueqingensis TaxID=658219 RepID=A0A1G8VDK2_9GAMM|nr:8-oxo-dGTP diphosphatase MutT [Microbulbifer yueqingensis]SDJ64182.1 8-oxo-dGTPase [Microbulbifer yueqingensis]